MGRVLIEVHRPPDIPESRISKLLTSDRPWAVCFCFPNGKYEVRLDHRKKWPVERFTHLILYNRDVLSLDIKVIVAVDESRVLLAHLRLGLIIANPNLLLEALSSDLPTGETNIFSVSDLSKQVTERAELFAQDIISKGTEEPDTTAFQSGIEFKLKSPWYDEGPLELIGLQVDSFDSTVKIVDPLALANERCFPKTVIKKMDSQVSSGVYGSIRVEGMDTFLDDVIVLNCLDLDAMGVKGRAILAPGVPRPEGTFMELEIVQADLVSLMRHLDRQIESIGG